LSSVKETKLLEATEPEEVVEETQENAGLNKALDTYRKLIEKKGGKDADPLTEKEQESLEKRISEIEGREVNSENLSIRDRKTGDVKELSFDDFLNEINAQTKGKPFTGLNLPKHLSKRPQLMV